MADMLSENIFISELVSIIYYSTFPEFLDNKIYIIMQYVIAFHHVL